MKIFNDKRVGLFNGNMIFKKILNLFSLLMCVVFFKEFGKVIKKECIMKILNVVVIWGMIKFV